MLYKLRRVNFWIMLVNDGLLVAASYFAAYLFRFEWSLPASQTSQFLQTVWWIVPVYLASFFFFNLYRGMWRYTSIADMINLVKAVGAAGVTVMTAIVLMHHFEGFSRSVFVMTPIFSLLAVSGLRVGIRLLYAHPIKGGGLASFFRQPRSLKKILIIGAGAAAEKLIRELLENPGLGYDMVGLIDDDPTKRGLTLHGVPVLGNLAELAGIIEKPGVEEIIIAVPSATARQLRHIITACEKSGLPCRTIPGLYELIDGRVSISKLREVCYEDLLQREPVVLDNDRICAYLTAKRVLVTGGAGSIGSELCRQIAGYAPAKLIILDRNESGLYELALDIQATFPELAVISALGAIQNRDRMEHVFSEHRPEVVFHAAAYKHVPMMEIHPWEAVFNNVVGSRVVLEMCRHHAVARCVVVSTDKAVRPTNVMGATKRLVEIMAQAHTASEGVRTTMVRFGNVLGSVGSVLPLFQKQIATGGPVTVTDPRVTRYFMTIPESCGLILQSGAAAAGGEIFVLKMGTPVCIDDMARDLITLSGYRPGEDIEIHYTGLRPGEKLYEELITEEEGIQKTQHPDIMILNGNGRQSWADLNARIAALVAAAKQGNADGICQILGELVPEYCPQDACAPLPEGVADVTGECVARHWEVEPGEPVASGPLLDLRAVDIHERQLLHLLSVALPDESEFRVEALSLSDWNQVISKAMTHQVAPLLYLRLKRGKKLGALPVNIRERLRKIYLSSTRLSLAKSCVLEKALGALNREKIPVIVLKGGHLGELVYRNISARIAGDIDLMVHRDDLDRAQAVIANSGAVEGSHALLIDLHWNIELSIAELGIDVARLWQRARDAKIAGCAVKVLCPEDLLLHLCVHLAFHHQFRFGGVRALCDIQEVLFRCGPDFKWDDFIEQVQALEIENAVCVTLRMAETLLGCQFPDQVLTALAQSGEAGDINTWALINIFGKQEMSGGLSPFFWEIWAANTLGQKAHALFHLVFPPREFIVQKYPQSHGIIRSGYYYMVRIVSNMCKYSAAAVRVMLRDPEMLAALGQQRENARMRLWMMGK